jgi:energy-coupling factor transporter transmembrane protein EcfT
MSVRERTVETDPDAARQATREEMTPVLMAAVLLGFMALIICYTRGYVLLYGDAVAHLGTARRIVDTRNPGLAQLGGVWLPLPHLLMLPFVWKMEWWQSGMAGAWPSLGCYIAGVAGFYRLCRRMLAPRWATVATVFYGLNPNLLYLATTAMTEPLFLALLVWMTLVTMECADAIRAGAERAVARRLVGLGGLILAAVFTRYDGWVLGAAVWCVVTWQLWRAGAMWRQVARSYRVFTLLAALGPALWLGYNWFFYHDPLDFMRGPYSAPAIDRRTTPPGAGHYRGWHSPGWALLIYTRTAQVDAAAWETGFALMAAAAAGLWIAMRRGVEKSSALLWVPLGFYVYSVAYGSVPIFIPELWPYSYYNSRYGMELLPALAVFGCVAAAALERRVPRRGMVYGVVLAAALLNPVAMIFGARAEEGLAKLMRRGGPAATGGPAPTEPDMPLVLKEALVNATTRVPFERDLALVLDGLPPGVPILMTESAHVGALQDAGIPLKQTVNEADWKIWDAALEAPASQVAYVVAFDGDEVANAVKAHPEGLEELTILCGTGQGCARVYRSLTFRGQ